jgi:hypothetical protein
MVAAHGRPAGSKSEALSIFCAPFPAVLAFAFFALTQSRVRLAYP